ncbi:histidine kinase [Coraliomargarita algicola]|uniref:histidine kinase n=1 Tax=Coraliomargarita algicola TaxID=3092156 RepID=A0ABZ0RIP8_9BACT|nr:ATP-binding protein [Coraliomargarita sp. J2-16]WPJ95942.1 histidine kinase [Coraliomargarita sp. J2-16]
MHSHTVYSRLLLAGCKYTIFAAFWLHISAGAEHLEQIIAANYLDTYQQNERRLEAISKQLENLPIPNLREPTGTGGFLSDNKEHADDEVVITFNWDQAHRIDATALFPLRLFMDEVYDENLYWPKLITIETNVDGSTTTLAQLDGAQARLRQSLPELVTFSPTKTDNLTIRCTGLQQHPNRDWHAAGFAEIFIFSEHHNLAPIAKLQTNGSRDGKYVLSSKFLTDNQTPLGLPQQAIEDKKKLNYFRQVTENKALNETPLTLTLHYLEPIAIDALRIDPVNHFYYGQGFPVRFTIELLDETGNILLPHNQYRRIALRNPALNPFIANFDETKASSIRITILETQQGVTPRAPTIELSEITALHRGLPLIPAKKIDLLWRNEIQTYTRGVKSRDITLRRMATLNNGETENGRIISQREWTEGLHQQQQLMEEQLMLRSAQTAILTAIRRGILMGSIGLVVIILATAISLIVRSRIKARQHVLHLRAQIASDLHDDVGSNLGTIILQTERLQDLIHTQHEQDRLKKILRLTKESVLGLQEVLQTTSPEIGHHKSLATHLQELTELMLGQTPYTIDIDPIVNDALTDNLTRGRFMLFYKEAVHNAKKHAQCKHVDISIKKDTRALILCIGDDGVGIDAKALSKASTLRTLKKRAEWLSGTLTIDSAKGKGTRLTLELPLNTLRRRSA